MSLVWTLTITEQDAVTLRAILERAELRTFTERRLIGDLLRELASKSDSA